MEKTGWALRCGAGTAGMVAEGFWGASIAQVIAHLGIIFDDAIVDYRD